MADNLKAAAYSAGLTPEQKREIEILSKKLNKHKELLNLPADLAQKSYQKMPADQQEDMVKTKRLGEIVTEAGFVAIEELDEALAEQKRRHTKR